MRNQYSYWALVCTLSAILSCFNMAPAIGKQSSSAKKRAIWVAVTNIRKGEKIQKGMIVRKMIPDRDYPNFAIEFSWLIVGKRPSHDLPPTKLIQESDFSDLAGINVPFLYTTRAIPAGARFIKSDFKLLQTVYYTRVPAFPQRPTNIAWVVGKKAKIYLKEGHYLKNSDISQ